MFSPVSNNHIRGRLYYSLYRQGGRGTLLAGRAGCVSGGADCCVCSCVCGVLTRGGMCGVGSFGEVTSLCVSSVLVLVGDGLGDKGEDRSTEVCGREASSLYTIAVPEQVKRP